MKQNKVCPKCNNKKILKIKDVLHSICTNCGYVEEYLDKEELYKLM